MAIAGRDVVGRFISGANAAYAETGMAWYPVASSNVAAIGWDDPRQVLAVRFHNGSIYEYTGVPPTIIDEFLAAPSKGKFVYYVLRRGYPAERVS